MQNKRALSISSFVLRASGNTGRFIMYSGITKNYYRKTVGHVFTKPEPLGMCQRPVIRPPIAT